MNIYGWTHSVKLFRDYVISRLYLEISGVPYFHVSPFLWPPKAKNQKTGSATPPRILIADPMHEKTDKIRLQEAWKCYLKYCDIDSKPRNKSPS